MLTPQFKQDFYNKSVLSFCCALNGKDHKQ